MPNDTARDFICPGRAAGNHAEQPSIMAVGGGKIRI